MSLINELCTLATKIWMWQIKLHLFLGLWNDPVLEGPWMGRADLVGWGRLWMNREEGRRLPECRTTQTTPNLLRVNGKICWEIPELVSFSTADDHTFSTSYHAFFILKELQTLDCQFYLPLINFIRFNKVDEKLVSKWNFLTPKVPWMIRQDFLHRCWEFLYLTREIRSNKSSQCRNQRRKILTE